MRLESKPLGFSCPDINCKLEYGSVSVEVQRTRWQNSEEKRKKVKGRTHDDYHKKSRLSLKPVEYALLNRVQAHADETSLKIGSRVLIEIQRTLLWQRSSVSERQILIDEEYRANARVQERKNQVENDSKFDVVEKVEEIDPRIYKIMKVLRNIEVLNESEKGEGEGEKSKDIIRWNPLKEIRKYRQSADPLRHIDINFMLNYFALRIAPKYPSILEFESPEKEERLEKAFDVVNRYRKQFSNKKWSYTWIEWFWIVAYSKSESIGKTRSMLRTLEGKQEIISAKHIRNRAVQVIDFWEDFIEYGHDFFQFLRKGLSLIKGDQELYSEYKRILQKDQTENKKYLLEMSTKRINEMEPNSTSDYNSKTEDSNTNGLNDAHALKITRTRPNRIRIYHYNPNYKQELIEFEKGLKKQRPIRRKRCGPFRLSELPSHAIIELFKQGKLKFN